jgi:uncharacterized alkaline shock family protein YloU
MTAQTTDKPQQGSTGSTGSGAAVQRTSNSRLTSSQGKTAIASGVVAKIAGMAAREVDGVWKMGSGSARAVGSLRERLPGSGGPNVSAGVTVEVGETQAAVDLDIVVEYGVSIVDLAQGVRRNVISALERMTGLEVTEVNIAVDDVHLPDEHHDDDQSDAPPRVR